MAVTTPFRVDFESVPFVLERSEAGGYIAHNDELQVAALGPTRDEAIASFRESLRDLVTVCAENHLPLPDVFRVA